MRRNRAAPKRRRLAPEVRRSLILDEAAKLVIAHGLTAVSMETVGRLCGISKALVYNYFPSRDQLLAALLQREQNELRDRGMRSALQARSFADLIRQTTRLYLEQTRERGALIQALLSDPSVARLMEEANRSERDRTIRYFVREGRREYGLTLPIAIAVVDMLMAVTDQAGKQTAAGSLDIDTAEEMCVALITGGLERLSERLKAPSSE
ncbi:TetR/AcrR family transcriptional regulator [Phenylobacterium sp.]|uniref:TetR/AcrR family transcriptional regulator n=1 Tax=Phenylobacterium sp. TaxID=1871053 RepID=UPI00374CECE4